MFRLKYKILASVSLGSHASTYIVRARFSKRRYIAKKTKPAQLALRELKALQLLKGKPGMPVLRDFYLNRNRCWFVFRYHRGGELYDRIQREEFPTVEHVRVLVRKLAEVTRTVSLCNIAHLDIRPENFVFDQEGGIHLIDFAHARVMYNPWMNSLISPVGTTPYAAPETQVLTMPYFTMTSDVYSLGVLYGFLTVGMTHTSEDETLQREMTYENPNQRADFTTVIARLTALLPPPPPR